jgi:hypothetical protein
MAVVERMVAAAYTQVLHPSGTAMRMLQQPLHQLRPLHAHRVTRPVFDIRGRHQLTTLFDTGD